MNRWIWVIDNQVPRLDLAAVYGVFSEIRIPSGLIKEPLSAALNGVIVELPDPLATVYKELLSIVVSHLELKTCQYMVECWSNRNISVGQNVDYHLDNDENEREKTGNVLSPAYGIIFYVGPENFDVGGTYFNPPIKDFHDDQRLFNMPQFNAVITTSGILVPFKPGRIIIFDGRCPHCVAPFAEVERPRVTILCNVWFS
jgi:hypothetical protein